MRHKHRFLFLSLTAGIAILAVFEGLGAKLALSLPLAAIPAILYSILTGIKDYQAFFLGKKAAKNSAPEIYRIILRESFIASSYKREFAQIHAHETLSKLSLEKRGITSTNLDDLEFENSSLAFQSI